MRHKLIKLLRDLEKESSFRNSYADELGQPEYDYEIVENMDFPNYRLIIRRYEKKYPLPRHKGQQPVRAENSIKGELKRMQMDGLLIVDTQNAVKYAYDKQGPDYDEGVTFVSESIILTTKGKSNWRYILYEATKNLITTIMSLIAIAISIIAIFL